MADKRSNALVCTRRSGIIAALMGQIMELRMRRRVGLGFAAAGMLLSGMAMADSVFVGTLERKDVKIRSYRNGVIEFTIAGRAVDPVPADRVTRIAVDDEPEFSKADQAFAEEDYAAAADGYSAALKTTTKPWLKDWILPRFLQAANRAGRLDLATTAFVQLAGKDLKAAMQAVPAVGENADARQLSAAAAELKRAASSGGNTSARQAILSLLMEVTRAQGDLAGASAVAEELLKSIPSDLSDPAVAYLVADIHLSIARLAMAQEDYAKALNQLEANRRLFTDPVQQAQALYALAVIADKQLKDRSPDALKDCALAYMKAVAVARQTPDRKNLPEALVRVAQIQEELGDLKSASLLYAEVAEEYKGTPIAATAAREQQRLREKTGM